MSDFVERIAARVFVGHRPHPTRASVKAVRDVTLAIADELENEVGWSQTNKTVVRWLRSQVKAT